MCLPQAPERMVFPVHPCLVSRRRRQVTPRTYVGVPAVLLRSRQQYRYGGAANDLVRDASQDCPRWPTTSVRGDGNEIGRGVLEIVQNSTSWLHAYDDCRVHPYALCFQRRRHFGQVALRFLTATLQRLLRCRDYVG